MSESKLSVRHLIGIKELSVSDIELLLDTAVQFKEVLQRPIKKVPSLRDITVANLFFENSSGSSVSKGETLLDTVQNILAMKVDMIVLRHPSVGAARYLSEKVNTQIINAGDGTHEHPTQALLDAFSIKEKFGKLKGVKVAIIGDILHSRVALSNIILLIKMGAEVKVLEPKSLQEEIKEKLEAALGLYK